MFLFRVGPVEPSTPSTEPDNVWLLFQPSSWATFVHSASDHVGFDTIFLTMGT